MEQQLSNVKLPDVSGKASVDVVGTISYTLSKYICLVTILMVNKLIYHFYVALNFSTSKLLHLMLKVALWDCLWLQLRYRLMVVLTGNTVIMDGKIY